MSDLFFTIETPIPGDAEGIYDVQKNTWLATYPNLDLGITEQDVLSRFGDREKRIAELRERFATPKEGRMTTVAKDISGNVLGFCFCSRENNLGELGAMYVLPEYQGQGVGKGLMDVALQWLCYYCDEISLEVAAYNTKAQEFYRRFGFMRDVDANLIDYELPNGKIIPCYRMVRKV
jgi:ribosomal protein S18 acetylase RimI-like enzyme